MKESHIESQIDDPYISLIEDVKNAIPADIRKVILGFEKKHLREEIVTQVYKNRWSPDLDFYKIFDLVRPYIIANKILVNQFEKEFKNAVGTGLILGTKNGPKAYTTSPFANDCIKVVEIMDNEIVDNLCENYYHDGNNFQIPLQFKDKEEAKQVFRTMVRSLLI